MSSIDTLTVKMHSLNLNDSIGSYPVELLHTIANNAEGIKTFQTMRLLSKVWANRLPLSHITHYRFFEEACKAETAPLRRIADLLKHLLATKRQNEAATMFGSFCMRAATGAMPKLLRLFIMRNWYQELLQLFKTTGDRLSGLDFGALQFSCGFDQAYFENRFLGECLLACRSLKKLTYSGSLPVTGRPILADYLISIGNLRDLTELQLEGQAIRRFRLETIANFLKPVFQNLRTLSLGCSLLQTSHGGLWYDVAPLSSLSRLRNLTLYGGARAAVDLQFLNSSTHVESLTLDRDTHFGLLAPLTEKSAKLSRLVIKSKTSAKMLEPLLKRAELGTIKLTDYVGTVAELLLLIQDGSKIEEFCLDCYQITDEDLLDICKVMPNLKILSLYSGALEYIADAVVKTISTLPLTRLDLVCGKVSEEGLSSIFTMTTLRELALLVELHDEITDGFLRTTKAATALQAVELTITEESVNPSLLIQELQALSQLKSLKLRLPKFDNNMSMIFHVGFRKLERLSITSTQLDSRFKMTRNGIQRLKNLQSLRHLELTVCVDYCSASNLEALSTSAPNLQSFTFNATPARRYLKSDEIDQVAQALTKMKHLEWGLIVGVKNSMALSSSLERRLTRETQIRVL